MNIPFFSRVDCSAWPLWLRALLAGMAGALLGQQLGLPLPWIIGALLGTATLRCAGLQAAPLPVGARLGQWILGIGIGLHFNAAILEQVLHFLPVILFSTLVTLLSSLLSIRIHLARGETPATAFFASMPGGANEMVNLGLRNRADLSRVATAQTCRVLLVLLSIPAFYTTLFDPVADTALTEPVPLGASTFALLLLAGAGAALLLTRLRVANAWMLGPLLASAALSTGLDLHHVLPAATSEVGQLLVGTTLGCHFSRPFFARAPFFLLRTAACTLVTLVVMLPIGLLTGWLVDLNGWALLLGMSPGGIAETSLTAEALNLLVPLVTAMQVLRLLLVLLLAEPLFRLWQNRRQGTARQG